MLFLVALLVLHSSCALNTVRVHTVRIQTLRKSAISMVTAEVPPASKQVTGTAGGFLGDQVIQRVFDDRSFYEEVDKDGADDEEEHGGLTPEQHEALQLNSIMKAIPEAAFNKSLWKSVAYMLFDYAMWGATVAAMLALTHSPIWAAMALWQKAATTAAYSTVAGFFMWCIFVIGHDCGHSNFSKHKLLNDIIGHITHGSILVPYFPWQLSHRRHHMFHNHVDKDYSYFWLTPEKESMEKHEAMVAFNNNPFLKAIMPFIGWPAYLSGSPDGNHFVPFKDQRMWKENPAIERKKCVISAAVVAAFASAIYFISGQNLANIAQFYLGPYIMFGWWLVTVTYLQHHGPDTVAYSAKDWKYVDAAFQTVDRKFGFGIDKLSHHITDGHVVHHLFFTKIPHYNLPMATAALRAHLEKHKLGWMYRFEKTYDFPLRVHKYFIEGGFRAEEATSSPHRPSSSE